MSLKLPKILTVNSWLTVQYQIYRTEFLAYLWSLTVPRIKLGDLSSEFPTSHLLLPFGQSSNCLKFKNTLTIPLPRLKPKDFEMPSVPLLWMAEQQILKNATTLNSDNNFRTNYLENSLIDPHKLLPLFSLVLETKRFFSDSTAGEVGAESSAPLSNLCTHSR